MQLLPGFMIGHYKMEATIINFKSPKPLTYFAPSWDYKIYEGFINKVNFKNIENLILKKEKEIKNTFTNDFLLKNIKKSNVDGYTNLGINSLTARYHFFNVLKWEDKNILILKKEIFVNYQNFLKILNIPRRKVWIKCWANVMRNGEKIDPHIHGVGPEIYLGGHICVKSQNTSTHYINPINQINDPEIYSSKNNTGKITFFPNHIPHFTDTYLGNSERITIAFDIVIEKTFKNLNENEKNNFIIFDNLNFYEGENFE